MAVKLYEISENQDHYGGEYSENAMLWRRYGAIDKARNISEIIAGRPVERVLEVGCGTGAVLREVISRGIGRHHVGIDVVDPIEHVDKSSLGLDLRHYDGVTIPFADDSFDFVYASHVLEHVSDPRGFLAELARVSSRYIYVEVPCEILLRSSRESVQTALDIGHINAFNPTYFLVTLQTAGLPPEDLRVFDHSLEVTGFGMPAWKGRLLKFIRSSSLALVPELATKLFCYHCGALVDLAMSKQLGK
ncbi:class I SAM-dependent methyltransferase [Altererythrobacter arenosus]|uniref:Class I SAM-dependent methyltransferase n=1 Tax=Altererythrobacter arenosus TaxID=3032592 RepID=A0ABY8FUN2_9SPHN|nr:class I SAM-dependent methyltransferase [Altererythrobacter sp. CAU 1644]WFL78714.1 class I SAM-dependent methyltransferase [Altererythrobacter sp. CAU 1644]